LYLASRLCLGHCRFVLGLIPIAILLQLGIESRLDFMMFCFECLSDFKFLKIINSALKIKLVEFDICTKNDRLPFVRLSLVENLNQVIIGQFRRFSLTFFTKKIWSVIV
jgi:hypothetical protein